MSVRLQLRLALLTLVILSAGAVALWLLVLDRPPGDLAGELAAEATLSEHGIRVTVAMEGGEALPPGVVVRLTLATPAGPVSAAASARGEPVTLELPYLRAGLTPYTVTAGNRLLTGELWREPGDPVTPLELKVGARAVRATESDRSALVVHPLDRHGNVSGEPVTVEVTTPAGDRHRLDLGVEHLLAWSFLPTGDTVGTVRVVAASGAARGERAEIDVLPGPLASGNVEIGVATAAADGRDPWRLRLTGATDALGNRAADGTAVRFGVRGEAGNLSATLPLVLGERAFDPVPLWSGDFSVRVAGDELMLAAASGLSATPAFAGPFPALAWAAVDPPTIRLGPAVDADGSLPDDGTAVILRIIGAAGTVLAEERAGLHDGLLEYPLPPLSATPQRVEVGFAGAWGQLDWPPEALSP